MQPADLRPVLHLQHLMIVHGVGQHSPGIRGSVFRRKRQPGPLLARWRQANRRAAGRTHGEPLLVGSSTTEYRPANRLRPWALLPVAACVVAAVAGGSQLAAPTSSAPSQPWTPPLLCHGTDCAGRLAADSACDPDATSQSSIFIASTRLELRTSHRCAAAWALVTNPLPGDRISILGHSTDTHTINITDPTPTSIYVATPMTSADPPTNLHACLERDSRRYCTP
ncbi:DUF2690 domain-containing protein [Nocardia gamkensis]|uniref:DUF2690 domain-containing protein n=1 Tax=Nocardia gamkensis TaxID=352869 RepID=UPI0036F11321